MLTMCAHSYNLSGRRTSGAGGRGGGRGGRMGEGEAGGGGGGLGGGCEGDGWHQPHCLHFL